MAKVVQLANDSTVITADRDMFGNAIEVRLGLGGPGRRTHVGLQLTGVDLTGKQVTVTGYMTPDDVMIVVEQMLRKARKARSRMRP